MSDSTSQSLSPMSDCSNIIYFMTLLLWILISGGFGGLVFGLLESNSYKIRIPRSGKTLELGFIGDILVGIAASIAALFVASPLFNLELDNISKSNEYIQLISLCVISGFAGIRLLSGISSDIVDRLTKRFEQAEKFDQVLELVRQADYFLEKNPRRALLLYEQVLQADSQNESALIGKATVFRKQERYREAIAILSKVIEYNSNADRAYYIRACYKNLVKEGYSKLNVLSDLERAVSLFPVYKDYALEDDDFEDLLDDPEFRAIVGEIEQD